MTVSPAAPRRTESRRERQRRELIADVLAAARTQLDAGGPGSVTWRGVARDVGMNPASLYTYFAGLDDLFTALISESFRSLAEAVSAAAAHTAAAQPLDRFLTCARAYRAWALANPQQFNLIWTDQLPGYAAPEDGPTYDAEQAVYRPFLRAVGDRYEDFGALPTGTQHSLLGLFAALHGLVSLEVNGHLAPSLVDGEACLTDQMASAFTRLEAE